MGRQRRTESRSGPPLLSRVERLEDRCVLAVGVLDPYAGLYVEVLANATFQSVVVYENVLPSRWRADRFDTAPVPIEAPPAPEQAAPVARIEWGDGAVTTAPVTTDRMGQTVIVAERPLEPATKYDVRLTLPSTDAAAPGDTVVTFQVTTAVPAPALAPAPDPILPAAAPAPRPVPATPDPEVAQQPAAAPEPAPLPPPSKPPTPTEKPPEQPPVVVRIVVGPPLFSTQPQFEAGAVRASLSAPAEPAVSVAATQGELPVPVSNVQVARAALPTTQPQAAEPTVVLASAPRSFEVLAALRGGRKDAGRLELRAAQPVADVEWHGVVLPAMTETDDVLKALAAEPVTEAPFFATSLPTEAAPIDAQRESLWDYAYVVVAGMIGLGVRHYFVKDDEPDTLNECTA